MNATTKNIAVIGGLGVLGYAVYKMLSSPMPNPASSASGGIGEWLAQLMNATPGLTDNPASIASSGQQFFCPRGFMFSNTENRCVPITVLDPQTHIARQSTDTSGPSIFTMDPWFWTYLNPLTLPFKLTSQIQKAWDWL